ncbi:P-loop containing nucleoside triphosphate hydrolase protein [Kockovaella imperatae]|uniref:p-loop containing nucleoside triphosphate hydrolase protein n=1 Tax=Kockovaella imperatae TaxID=4999 RepID=A0A1Y1UHV5_9TREE|nr:P-loop containing nucleoside triphosphate hydrolase protein [Kockovaella imperatae]ORX36665.1 P-loop containing nucleoside triphosphate hydrolase protein [Kockovaella imperatae]
MVKTGSTSNGEASMKVKRRSNDLRTASEATETPESLFLDQSEILKSMMAAKVSKGKERETSSEGSDGEDGVDSEDDIELEDVSEPGDDLSARSPRRLQSDIDGSSEAESSWAASRRASPPNQRLTALGVSRISLGKTRGVQKPSADEPKPSLFSSAGSKNETFESLGLSRPLITALAGISIRSPTEIQSACVPQILKGRDCIGGAKTGSGKTLAFALPIVERIARDPFGIWAVVLTPTRELAYQLAEQFIAVGKPLGLETITVVGGMDMMGQAAALEKRPHIVVATPGRLCDLLRSSSGGVNKLSRAKVLVLDEADRMLTPTFAPDLAYLFSQMPADRQTCLFTATINDTILQLAEKPAQPGRPKPFMYRVESDTKTVLDLKQKYLFIPSQIRDPYLVYLLHHPPSDIDTILRTTAKPNKDIANMTKSRKRRQRSESEESEDDLPPIPSTIIFTQRCATAHLVHLLLNQLEIPSVPLHSHLTQPHRLESLARFRAQQVPILVTTDVGSRGLDIPQVAMVINWDCPRRSDDYIHRVGRTARAGRGGVAVTVVTEKDVDLVQMIESEVGVKMEELDLPEEQVLESLNSVSVARRVATMEMHDTGFGERQATNKAKALRNVKRAKRDAGAKA